MVLLREKDDLSRFKGLASEAFGSQRLAYLENRFKSSQPAEAVDLLASFITAAEDVRDSENRFSEEQFNKRARKAGPDLKANLRNGEQLVAIKAFREARANLLDLDTKVGKQIVNLVEKSLQSKPRGPKHAFPG